jgi:flagella basal body P-ring formation protein FlgA
MKPRSAVLMRRLYLLVIMAAVLAVRCAEANQSQGGVQQLESELRNNVAQRTGWKPGDFELRVIGQEALPLSSGPLRFRVLRGPANIVPGMQSFQVSFESEGKDALRTFVRTQIRLFEDVVVLVKPLGRRELVNALDVRLERRELASVSTKPYTRIEDVIGKQTARPSAASEVETEALLERPTLIRSGSAITLIYDSDGLHVETSGIAEEAGKAGDFIQVKNAASGKTMRGQVLNERTVKVN